MPLFWTKPRQGERFCMAANSASPGQPGSFMWVARTLEPRFQGCCSWCPVSGVPITDLSATGHGTCRVMPGMPILHGLPCSGDGVHRPHRWASDQVEPNKIFRDLPWPGFMFFHGRDHTPCREWTMVQPDACTPFLECVQFCGGQQI